MSDYKCPWNDWYHCMGHTYGTWLPGDPKGFRTRHHREHIEGDYKHPPPKGMYDKRHEQAKDLMKRDPIFLTIDQRLLIVRLLVESLQRRNFDIATACVIEVHFHILARIPDHDPGHWIGVAKKESSHYAKEQSQAPAGGLWAVRSKSLPIHSRGHQLNTAKYIFDHCEEGAAVWYRNSAIECLQP
ncbi:MAG TPA: hypothetical protein VLJ39_08860 [Tepidisphaeraceae bacterium]|nr:hypothetical protein [Tepidisphaeraceae bacterium]